LAKLIVNPTSPQRQELALPRTLMSIGRDPSNDLVLPDAMVSRRHAVIELRGTQYYLRDCNSSNGSLVNGDRISERSLRDGDLVAIGTARLLFREDVEALDPAGKIVQHPSAPRLRCVQCGTDYRRGDQFCKQCGGTLQSVQPKSICTACGTAVPLPARFCNACGGRLSEQEAASEPVSVPGPSTSAPVPGPDFAEPNLKATAPAVEVAPPAPSPKPPDPVALEPPPVVAPHVAPAAQPAPASASDSGSADKTVPPPLRPRPLSVVAGGASPAADRSWAPAPRPLREAPPRLERSPAAPVAAKPRDEGGDLSSRLLAGVLDLAVVGLMQTLLLAYPAFYWWSRDLAQVGSWPVALSAGLLLLTGALGALYFIYYWGVRGATPGKRLLGLNVEASDGSFPIGLPRAAARFLGYLLSAALLGGGFLLILLDGNGLHDRLAGTRVVRRRR
jgi:uncharacterized RDD family membrane protein YckC/predicted nucleic acid-binding Zn ribbon protein